MIVVHPSPAGFATTFYGQVDGAQNLMRQPGWMKYFPAFTR